MTASAFLQTPHRATRLYRRIGAGQHRQDGGTSCAHLDCRQHRLPVLESVLHGSSIPAAPYGVEVVQHADLERRRRTRQRGRPAPIRLVGGT